jgi:hypothetical protein
VLFLADQVQELPLRRPEVLVERRRTDPERVGNLLGRVRPVPLEVARVVGGGQHRLLFLREPLLQALGEAVRRGDRPLDLALGDEV